MCAKTNEADRIAMEILRRLTNYSVANMTFEEFKEAVGYEFLDEIQRAQLPIIYEAMVEAGKSQQIQVLPKPK